VEQSAERKRKRCYYLSSGGGRKSSSRFRKRVVLYADRERKEAALRERQTELSSTARWEEASADTVEKGETFPPQKERAPHIPSKPKDGKVWVFLPNKESQLTFNSRGGSGVGGSSLRIKKRRSNSSRTRGKKGARSDAEERDGKGVRP